MRRILLIVVCVFFCQALVAQEGRKEFDFIVSIDRELPKTLYNPRIIVKDDNLNRKVINVSYYPGRLSFSHGDFDSLLSLDKGVRLFLKFDHYESSKKGAQKLHNYEIEVGKNWFDQAYIILKIYNIGKKKRKLYPLGGKDYTFDLDYPGGSMLHVQE